MNYTYPEQRVSISKKLKPEWYENNIRYWITIATNANDKKDTQINLDAANGIVSSETYDYVLSPLQPEGNKLSKLPGEIRNIDFITPIKEKNLGEYIDLPYQYSVKVNDPDIAMKRRVEVSQMIQPIIEQFVINKINEQQQTEAPSVDMGNLQEEIKKITQSWIDERVIHSKNIIEFVNDINEFEIKRINAFYNWWATEEIYFYVYASNGGLYFDIISPLEGFPVLAGEDFTDDGDAFMIKRKMSLGQIYTYYGDKLSKQDREYLDNIINKQSVGGSAYNIPAIVYKDAYGRRAMDADGRDYGDNENLTFGGTDIIDEYVVLYKTEVKHKILTKITELGQIMESMVDDDYIINYEEGDIEVRDEWISEAWSQVLLGDFNTGIYLKPEPIAVQIYDSIGNVKLPVPGKKGIFKHMDINPIPKRVLPSLALYRIINLHIERQLAKYKSPVEVIPKGLLAAQDGSIRANMFYKMADSTIIYDENKFSGVELDRSYKIIGNSGVSNYIRDLIDLRDSIKSEAWDLANMNDARFGQAAASATVRNNEQNLYRAKLGSILMTTVFNTVLSKLHTLCIEYAKVVYSGGLSGSLFNSDGGVNYFDVPSGIMTDAQLGIFVNNSVLEKNKLDEYKNIAFSAAQSGDFELSSEAIALDNVSHVREAIKKFTERKRAFESEQAQLDRDAQMQVVQANQELENVRHENKLSEIETEQKLITERDIAVAQIKAASTNNKEI